MDGDLQRLVGDNVRARRKAVGETQEEFARLFPFHYTYLGSIERGERNLSLQSVERLAGMMGVEPLTLFGLPDGARPETAARN